MTIQAIYYKKKRQLNDLKTFFNYFSEPDLESTKRRLMRIKKKLSTRESIVFRKVVITPSLKFCQFFSFSRQKKQYTDWLYHGCKNRPLIL